MITLRHFGKGMVRVWTLIVALIVAGAIAFAALPAEAQSPPATPSSVTVTRADGSLTASGYSVADATKYHVTYSSDNGASWSLAALAHTASSITISGVDNSNTYIVGVRAGNDDGWSGWRNSPSSGPYTPPPPPSNPPDAPSSVTVTRGDGTLSVSWSSVNGATSYNVNTSDNGKASWSRAASGVTGTSTTVTGATNSSTYVVAVQAVNSSGGGSWRNSGSVGPYTPPSTTPPPDTHADSDANPHAYAR